MPRSCNSSNRLPKEKQKNITLSLIGGGVSEFITELETLASELDVSDIINWLGHKDTATPYISKCDVVLVCSKIECFPRVVAESMRLKKLVIVSDRGALPEMVTHQKTGLVYSHGDIPQLVDQITWAMDHPEEVEKIQENAYKWVTETLTPYRYQHQILSILNDL